jgi:hypothetical protein
MAVADFLDRSGRSRSLQALGPTILLVSGVCGAILGFVVFLVLTTDYPFSYFSRDPAIQAGESAALGFLSYIGVLITWGGSAVAVFAGLMVAWAKGWRVAWPLLLAGIGAAYLALDDLLLFHDDLYPSRLGLDEDVVESVYGVVALAFLWWYRDFFRRNEWPVLALAGAALAGSVLVDITNTVGERPERFVEESLKLFGLGFLAAYLVRLSAHMSLWAFAPVPAADEPAPQRSAGAASAVATPSPTYTEPET